ncbi:MAG: low-complexity protein, partial [Kovacikia sp.]
ILNLLEIVKPANESEQPVESSPQPAQPVPRPDRRARLYQEVVRQIQHIILSQTPDQIVQSVQQLLEFLDRQGISTEEIQKKMLGQVIVQRAKQDKNFREHLLRWEKTATEAARISTMGQAMRAAIVLLWTQTRQS